MQRRRYMKKARTVKICKPTSERASEYKKHVKGKTASTLERQHSIASSERVQQSCSSSKVSIFSDALIETWMELKETKHERGMTSRHSTESKA